MGDVAKKFDLAYLYADGQKEDIYNLAKVAFDIGARCAMTHLGDLQNLKDILSGLGNDKKDDRVRIEAVIDFPDGAGGALTKEKQASYCADLGIDGVDVVINLRQVLDGQWGLLGEELKAVRLIMKDVKAIIQLPYLWKYDRDAIPFVLNILVEQGIMCVKDWTTRSDNFLKPVDVDEETRLAYLKFISEYIAKNNLPLLKKIAGKVNPENARRFLDAGADILGISYGKAFAIKDALENKK